MWLLSRGKTGNISSKIDLLFLSWRDVAEQAHGTKPHSRDSAFQPEKSHQMIKVHPVSGLSQAEGRLFTEHPLVKPELICQCISISNFLYESLSLERRFFKYVLLRVTCPARKLWLTHALPIWTSPNGWFMVTIRHKGWRNLCSGYFVCFQDVVETPSPGPADPLSRSAGGTCQCFLCFVFFLDVLSWRKKLKRHGELLQKNLQNLRRLIRNRVKVS